jgi:hypothetical protein
MAAARARVGGMWQQTGAPSIATQKRWRELNRQKKFINGHQSCGHFGFYYLLLL